MIQHPLDVLDDVGEARVHRRGQVGDAKVAPLLDRVALLLGQVLQFADLLAAREEVRPVVDGLRGSRSALCSSSRRLASGWRSSRW